MVEEKVVTIGFSKKTLKPSPTSSTQQSCGQAYYFMFHPKL